ncbi:MAG TPA: ribonuclease H-like domain-containing protein [Aggregatilinea sp.]|uniref:ribonuclease H-like domain-containing protein n=1 Tax=Aggregatilinea sp. TaxID=2806333 RepID=UPI002C5050C6|nr:ribonuclease H-like domain-containing protein [Aggregatilinea sp.]HML24121.1 ribonuclease H-like domain-containing protein [Aggregatilinea sp.]
MACDLHLELLYNVSRKTREGLREAGITSLAQIAALSIEDLQRVKGIGKVTAPMIRANAQAWLASQPVWYNPLPDVCDQCGWMFDLETLQDGTPWCMGWCDEHGNTQIALVAPVEEPQTVTLLDGQQATLAPDSDSVWTVFAESAAMRPGPIYHWTGYDSAIMRATAPQDVIDRLHARLHDLHGTVKRSVSFPLGSTSIKVVAAYLGYPWPGYNDWFAAFLDYREWLYTGSPEALTRACMYQRADVESMAWVWRWMVQDGGLR